MSATRSRGFVAVSKNSTFVAGVIAASTAARSVMSTGVTPMPRRGKSSSSRTRVMTNSSSPTTTWSPLPEVREERRRDAGHPRRRDDRVLGAVERGELLLEGAGRRVRRSASRSTTVGSQAIARSTASSFSAAVSKANVAVA